MTQSEILPAIEHELVDLEQISFVAHRDIRKALDAIQSQGLEIALEWIHACKALFQHDRDAGKAFIRGSRAVLEASGEVLTWTRQALFFLQWSGSWKALDGFMVQLPDAYRILGVAGEARWAELGIAWCGRHLESGTAYFRCPLAELAATHGIAGVEELVLPAENLFNQRRLALATYLPGAIRVRNLLGVEAVQPWAKRGADILLAGRLRGEAYFKLESDESMAILLENLPGFRTPKHQRLLQLILYAWFGESFDLLDSNWSPDQGRAFVETDGVALYLPIALPSREEAILALMHAAGHLAFHSFERRYIEALFRTVGLEHPPQDADQRIIWQPLFTAFGEDTIRFELIFDLCEDLRVDTRIAARVPNYLNRLLAAAAAVALPEGASAAYYQLARETLYWVASGARHNTKMEPFRPMLLHTATIVDAFRLANVLYTGTTLPPITRVERDDAFLPGRAPNVSRPVVYLRHELDHPEFGAATEEPDDVVNNHEIEPDAEKKGIPQHAAGEDVSLDLNRPAEETKTSFRRVRRVRVDTLQPARVTAPPGGSGGVAPPDGGGIPQPARVTGQGRGAEYSEKGKPYDEWDYRDGRYKLNWAWVQEKKLTELDAAEAAKLLSQYAPALKRLKRAIQTQKPLRMAPLRRQFDGDELDLEAVIDYIAEKRAGMSPKANIYRQRVMRQRDTAVTLLADMSTSIMQPSAQGGGRVVDHIRAGMLLFAESMEEVGDLYSLAGFASKYRDNVSYYSIKRFDQRLTPYVRAVLGGLSGRLATRMGAAIRHAVQGFDRVPAQRRLLLILSDGRPADYDDGGDERYLHEDTRMAVKEAMSAGVHPFCITLDAAGSQYLPQIFGPGHYLVLNHINDLPKKLPEVYLRLRK